MNTIATYNQIINQKFNKDFKLLYGEYEKASKRYCDAIYEFEKLFGTRREIRMFSAPGRTEIGGNHTDHQHGMVLAGSVNLDVIAIVSANDDNIIRIQSQGYPMDEIDISNLEINEKEKGRSSALILGVVAAFKHNGYDTNFLFVVCYISFVLFVKLLHKSALKVCVKRERLNKIQLKKQNANLFF